MNIFGNLFSRFNLNNGRKRYNENDKTSYKVQVQNKALVGIYVERGNDVFRVLTPKKIYKKYIAALKKLDNHEKFTPSEADYVRGYLNPKYHTATEPRKRK